MRQDKTFTKSNRDDWVRFTRWLPLFDNIVLAGVEISPGVIESWRIHFDKNGIPAKIMITGGGIFKKRALYIIPRRLKRGIVKSQGDKLRSGNQEDTL